VRSGRKITGMATNLSLRTRAAAVAGVTALATIAASTPAWADAPMPGSANDTVMTTGQAILVFAGIPLLVVAVVYLLVSAPGWTRSGRGDAGDAWAGEPLTVGGGAVTTAVGGATAGALEAPAGSADAAPDETGGTSARW
jgi:hypothetical protein